MARIIRRASFDRQLLPVGDRFRRLLPEAIDLVLGLVDQSPFARELVQLVGRLGDKKLMVLGTGTAREWPHIFRGTGWVTGIELTMAKNDPGASDQVAFHEVGVPAVQLFTGPNEDYHRPSDTALKVDPDGLVKVATIVKEAVEYLASREEPMHASLGDAEPAKAIVTTSHAKVIN